jgi:hypothetical protein
MDEHTYALKLDRFIKNWSEDEGHKQHKNTKGYLQDKTNQELHNKLENHFWGQIKVLFRINISASIFPPATSCRSSNSSQLPSSWIELLAQQFQTLLFH